MSLRRFLSILNVVFTSDLCSWWSNQLFLEWCLSLPLLHTFLSSLLHSLLSLSIFPPLFPFSLSFQKALSSSVMLLGIWVTFWSTVLTGVLGSKVQSLLHFQLQPVICCLYLSRQHNSQCKAWGPSLCHVYNFYGITLFAKMNTPEIYFYRNILLTQQKGMGSYCSSCNCFCMIRLMSWRCRIMYGRIVAIVWLKQMF